ncbi:hypothetical protein NPIL_570001 [Nephila pilipes]|uniref:Uncharacterized protein n=1 Tax=Nephila pilipes TaxID=299642 RepID=A0A8X6Q4G4_NEPPI|nr:hypothetical protein NPIL_570001 [Nephila pilipes]
MDIDHFNRPVMTGDTLAMAPPFLLSARSNTEAPDQDDFECIGSQTTTLPKISRPMKESYSTHSTAGDHRIRKEEPCRLIVIRACTDVKVASGRHNTGTTLTTTCCHWTCYDMARPATMVAVGDGHRSF